MHLNCSCKNNVHTQVNQKKIKISNCNTCGELKSNCNCFKQSHNCNLCGCDKTNCDCGKIKQTDKIECQSKIAFISIIDIPKSIMSTKQYINKLRSTSKIYTAEALEYRFIELFQNIPPCNLNNVNASAKAQLKWINTILKPVIALVDAWVQDFRASGFKYIGVPEYSIFLEPWLLGNYIYTPYNSTDIVSVPLRCAVANSHRVDVVFADLTFMTSGAYTNIIDKIGNIINFSDTYKPYLFSLLNTFNINQKINPHLIIISQNNDIDSNIVTERLLESTRYIDKLTVEKIQYISRIDIEKIIDIIKLKLADPDIDYILIALSINSAHSDNFIIENLDLFYFNNPKLQYYATNFCPYQQTLPIDLHYGIIPIQGIPSDIQTDLGLPLNYKEYTNIIFNPGYIRSYAYAAGCKNFITNVTGLEFKLHNNSNTFVSQFLHSSLRLANSTIIKTTDIIPNEQWS